MCGIYVYSGKNQATDQVLAGLSRLLYRGYDSWGVAWLSDGQLKLKKQVGALKVKQVKLSKSYNSTTALGHTRWATHGAVRVKNAHPHLSSKNGFALVQNGIVENFHELKKSLIDQGYKFISDTDTEVIVKLIERERGQGLSWLESLRKVYELIHGRNTIALLTNQGEIWAVRYGSPLVVAKSNQAFWLSSDVVSLPKEAKKIAFVDNLKVVNLDEKGNLSLFDLKTKKKLKPRWQTHNLDYTDEGKQGYQHYMLKELNQSPLVIKQLVKLAKEAKFKQAVKLVKQVRQVFVVGSGSAGVAAGQIAYYLRTIAQVPAVSLIGADAESYLSLMDQETLVIAPSQSGETADVLEVLEAALARKAKLLTYVNMPDSMMTRLADVSLLAQAGPEICVMSTKVVLSQMAFGYLLAQAVVKKTKEATNELNRLATNLEEMLASLDYHRQLKNWAKALSKEKDIYLLGKGSGFNVVAEGMIKLIEGSYLHAHALPAGDLKHYVITIVESGTPIIGLVQDETVLKDMTSALTEVKARGAKTYALSYTQQTPVDEILVLPKSKLVELEALTTLQFLGYYTAKELGNNIDKPRHIAKSVTVK